MRKDVIYIDVEDDITAIIGKVKASAGDVVALVPPKRIGSLQSAVNLKLLQKAAGEASKRIVLVTSDHVLTSLAAGIKIPVAKNLQTKPEVPVVSPAEAEESEIINGDELPVGELAGLAAVPVPGKVPPSTAETIAERVDLSNKPLEDGQPAPGQKPSPQQLLAKKFGKLGKANVPDFNKFRKRLFLIGGGVLLLVAFLVWALVIAPTAVITITAQTSPVPVSETLNLAPSSATNLANLQLKPGQQQLKDAESVNFTPTGSKNIGDKATGTLTLDNNDGSPITIPGGTQFTAQGLTFTSDKDVTVPGATVSHGSVVDGTATVTITAGDIGAQYNIGPQSYTTSAPVGASASAATSGGSSQTVTVVSQDDVNKAQAQLTQQISQKAASLKSKLEQQVGNDQLMILESYTASTAAATSSPAVDQQASGQATLTQNTTYSMLTLARSDVRQILASALQATLSGKPGQTVFDDGGNHIIFQSYQQQSDGTATVILTTTARIGAKIDSQQIAQQVKGKVYGDVQQIINQIPGVDKANIQLSPFWVTSVPGDLHKVSIKFTIVNGN